MLSLFVYSSTLYFFLAMIATFMVCQNHLEKHFNFVLKVHFILSNLPESSFIIISISHSFKEQPILACIWKSLLLSLKENLTTDRVFRYFKLKVSNKRETGGPWATMTTRATMLNLLTQLFPNQFFSDHFHILFYTIIEFINQCMYELLQKVFLLGRISVYL